jgi:hypothetical protein
VEDRRRILVVANRTAATEPLLSEIRRRAALGLADYHLVMPASPHGLHRVVDPEDNGRDEATARLGHALPLLSRAAGTEVTGEVGSHDPLGAVADALHRGRYDEIIVSTLPRRVSRWLKLDLPSKIGALGLPITLVNPDAEDTAPNGERELAGVGR